jgi:hypothetical protein
MNIITRNKPPTYNNFYIFIEIYENVWKLEVNKCVTILSNGKSKDLNGNDVRSILLKNGLDELLLITRTYFFCTKDMIEEENIRISQTTMTLLKESKE